MDDKPRPKAPTLVGIGPPGAAVVVGAVGRLQVPATHSVETQRMVFEPAKEPEVEPSPTTAAVEAGEPQAAPSPTPPPAMAEPVAETPVLPPVAPVSEPFELARPVAMAKTSSSRSAGPEPQAEQHVQRTSRWPRVIASLVGVAAIAAGVSLRHDVKKWMEGEGRVAVPVSTSTSTPTPTPTPSTTPSQERSPATPSAWFNAYAARRSLDETGREVAKCRRGKAFGIAVATVTFANDGSVSDRVVSPPFAGTPTGACVGDALSQAHVAPFAGKPGVLVYRFFVAPN